MDLRRERRSRWVELQERAGALINNRCGHNAKSLADNGTYRALKMAKPEKRHCICLGAALSSKMLHRSRAPLDAKMYLKYTLEHPRHRLICSPQYTTVTVSVEHHARLGNLNVRTEVTTCQRSIA